MNGQEIARIVEELQRGDESIHWVARVRTLTPACDFQREKVSMTKGNKENCQKLNWEKFDEFRVNVYLQNGGA